MAVRIIQGDALTVLKALPNESVQCCVTSPPYWSLRNYGVEGQLGLEVTPGEYVTRLAEVLGEVRRVLRSDGTLWLNLGDCYCGARGGAQGKNSDFLSREACLNGIRERSTDRIAPGLKPKDLVGVPWRVAFALQADGWWLRQEIVWHKPNPMPESVQDRPTRAHETVFLLSRSERYYYDAGAVKEPVTGGAHRRGRGVNPKAKNEQTGDRRRNGFNERWRVKQNESFSAAVVDLVDARNMRSVWTLPTQPFPGAHFATMPRSLAERCILAGCPLGGTVLDPFGGAGTTGLVADRLGRDAILIELNPAYCKMAEDRIRDDSPLLASVTT